MNKLQRLALITYHYLETYLLAFQKLLRCHYEYRDQMNEILKLYISMIWIMQLTHDLDWIVTCNEMNVWAPPPIIWSEKIELREYKLLLDDIDGFCPPRVETIRSICWGPSQHVCSVKPRFAYDFAKAKGLRTNIQRWLGPFPTAIVSLF